MAEEFLKDQKEMGFRPKGVWTFDRAFDFEYRCRRITKFGSKRTPNQLLL